MFAARESYQLLSLLAEAPAAIAQEWDRPLDSSAYSESDLDLAARLTVTLAEPDCHLDLLVSGSD